jgi:diguanylate cyclase (GGDEF)-like protein
VTSDVGDNGGAKTFGRRRLLLSVIALLLLGSIVTSTGSFLVGRRSVRAGIRNHELPLTGDNIYSEVQRDLLRPVSISDQMANDTFLQDWATRGETDPTIVVRYLAQIEQRFGTTTSFFVSEKTRNYYHPTGILKVISETDAADAWYFAARKMTTEYEINVDADTADRSVTTVFINYRVFDAAGTFLGITGVGLKLDAIGGLITSYEDRFQRHIYFVDRAGNLALTGTSATQDKSALAKRPGMEAIAKEILAGKTEPLTLSYERGGSHVLVNTRFIPDFNWFLVVEQDESASVRPLERVLLMNLLVGAVVATLVGIVLTFTINRYQRRLVIAATTDLLTGALNRRKGESLLREAVTETNRTSKVMSVLMFDVDHFKLVNDRFGHLVGDAVLRSIADEVRSATRATDSLVRWGGEEFIVVLPNCEADQAAKIAGSICDLVATLHMRNSSIPSVTVSIGVAESARGDTWEALLTRADTGLYAAKANGRNRVEVHQTGITPAPIAS